MKPLTLNIRRRPLTGFVRAKRCFASTIFIALATLMQPMSVGAGQGSASFQISLRIAAPPPAPMVSRQVISAASPGYPPHPMFKDQVMTEEKSGDKFIVLKTEF